MLYRNLLLSGDEGNRTPGLSIANATLSHLSYIPTYLMFNKTKDLRQVIETVGIKEFGGKE